MRNFFSSSKAKVNWCIFLNTTDSYLPFILNVEINNSSMLGAKKKKNQYSAYLNSKNKPNFYTYKSVVYLLCAICTYFSSNATVIQIFFWILFIMKFGASEENFPKLWQVFSGNILFWLQTNISPSCDFFLIFRNRFKNK